MARCWRAQASIAVLSECVAGVVVLSSTMSIVKCMECEVSVVLIVGVVLCVLWFSLWCEVGVNGCCMRCG